MSAFFHVTLSPTVMVVALGVNPLFTIWTVFVSAPAAATTTSVANERQREQEYAFHLEVPPSQLASARCLPLANGSQSGSVCWLYRFLTMVWVPLCAASRPLPAWFTVRKTRMCETPFGR